MLPAVQQLLLGRMREPVASLGIPIGVFAINRVARMPGAFYLNSWREGAESGSAFSLAPFRQGTKPYGIT
jgi:hypothetical protein